MTMLLHLTMHDREILITARNLRARNVLDRSVHLLLSKACDEPGGSPMALGDHGHESTTSRAPLSPNSVTLLARLLNRHALRPNLCKSLSSAGHAQSSLERRTRGDQCERVSHITSLC